MHIVSRPSMLALTVDRLVGTGHSPHHHHLPLSPSSDSSGGSSTSPAPTKPTPTTPSHFSKITLLLSNNSPPNRNSSPVLISCEERAVVKVKEEPEVKMETDRCLNATPDSVILATPDRCRLCPSAHQEDSQSDEDDGCSSASRSPRLADDHCCGRTGPESPLRNNITGTPSSLSSPQPQQSLKFSIHDILRPDFGQRALSRPTVQHSYLSVPQPGHHRVHPYKPQNSRSRNSSGLSTSASTVVEPRRPSSVKTHSEDSNSSSTSRTTAREEVVDESKVNPAVPKGPLLWPAWVYCTRYSDRPSSGPRSRRIVRTKGEETRRAPSQHEGDEKRPRTAFTAEQLGKLKREFDENRYLTEKRRQDLARDLKLHENQIKIWFQNKRAKLKKSSGQRGGLALQLMAQGLYNHSTVGVDEEEDYLPC